MREIKFRCWNVFSGCMHSWDEMVEKNKIYLLRNKNKSNICEQFTGLLDKNGVEIYEGDIVIVTRVEECDTDNEKETVIIGSPEYLELSGWETGGPENVWVVTEKEVIGNIHQNPELME